MTAKLIINQDLNGLELYFTAKPDESVLSELRTAKWRYHRAKWCWYARQTPANRALADKLAGGSGTAESDTPDSFFPAYDCVGGASIFRTADVSCWEHNEGYFADVNAYIMVRVNRIIIIDLSNALVPGKECMRLSLEPEDPYGSESLHAGLDTFRAVYDRFFVERAFPKCHVYESKLKSMNTFTPFKKIKPIKTPEKWTLPHVWKAILSGQIFMGVCDGRYTDDYAYDAAVDFRSGVRLHLPTFAQQLIDSPSGWWVHPDKRDGDVIALSVNCHHFDTNTLYFEESCDWAENTRRREQREAERQQHNADMKARLLSEAEVLEKTKDGLIFDVTLLEMDQNTDRYDTRREVMLRREFLSNGHLWRDVLEVAPRTIDNTDLYEMNCGEYIKADRRVICYEERCIVTGKALTELLTEHADDEQIASVSVCYQAISDLQAVLDDMLMGRICNLFNPTPRAKIISALERLSREEERAYEA